MFLAHALDMASIEAHALRPALLVAGHVSAFDVTALALQSCGEALLAEFIKLLESLVETELISAFPVSASLAEAWDLGQPKLMSLVEGL